MQLTITKTDGSQEAVWVRPATADNPSRIVVDAQDRNAEGLPSGAYAYSIDAADVASITVEA
jgi:hypothetical protein